MILHKSNGCGAGMMKIYFTFFAANLFEHFAKIELKKLIIYS
jgi:hypothetical protein